MTPEVRTKIEQIQHGNVPEGYKKGKIGIVPVEWDEVPFSTLFTSTIEYTDDLKKYPLHSLTIEDGITAKTERYERSHLVKKENSYKVVRPNDYAYNPMNIRFGAVARHKGDISVSVSGYYDIFTTIHESDLVFMDSFLTCGPMITYYNKVSTGSLIEKQRVHFSDFLEFSLALPPLEERKKIAEILTTQDKVIELEQQKIEEIKKVKKFFLSKMFPKKGQAVPEIRFKGFTDAWEQRKLGDVCQVTMGQSPDGSTYSDTPSDYILVQGNADLKDGWVSPRIWTTQKTKTAEAGDLIMSVRAPAGSMGKTSYNVVLGRGVAGIKGNEFIYQSLVKMDSDGYWKKLAAGSTFESINSDVVNGAELMVPQDIDEQNKIGDYFASIDALITLHQRKLEEEKQKKKALIQLLLTGIVRV